MRLKGERDGGHRTALLSLVTSVLTVSFNLILWSVTLLVPSLRAHPAPLSSLLSSLRSRSALRAPAYGVYGEKEACTG